MKKFIAILLAVVLVAGTFVACGGKKEGLKVGFIFLHNEQSTYDLNFMNAAKEACEKMGVEMIQKTGIDESGDCTEAALDLVDRGCTLIFADSFGHEPYLIEAAKKCPEVQFCHATGTRAHTEKLANYHNAFASIYEGRYLAGVAAGMKLNEMIAAGEFTAEEAKMGYVGAFTYAEVISGYTSFYLGAKSICPSVTMDVHFTGNWCKEDLENESATMLINKGCKLISQHADSMGAPNACQSAGVPNISYNGSTKKQCPDTFIVSSRINWTPYMEYIIQCVKDGKAIDTDWVGTLATGSVELSEINDKEAAKGTKEKIDEVKAGLEAGTIKVFDTNNFKVGGKPVKSYQADIHPDGPNKHIPDTEVIIDGAFSESSFRSAPYFDLEIDGITLLNRAYGD